MVASPDLVLGSSKDGCSSTNLHSQQPKDFHCQRTSSRTTEEQTVEIVRLEDQWKARLIHEGWTESTASVLGYFWAPSTLRQYNSYISKFCMYCQTSGYVFPPPVHVVADYLYGVAKSSSKPRSLLKCKSAALSNLYISLNVPNPMSCESIKMLLIALVKVHTTESMSFSKVMPMEPFIELFKSWPDNEQLDIKQLRIKTNMLLSLCAMLRPSDIAPKSVYLDKVTGLPKPIVFSKDQIKFVNGAMELTIFGVKNDRQRTGFEIWVQPHTDKSICAVSTLKQYISLTDKFRSQENNAVFLSLRAPYKYLQSESIAKDLEMAIELAGLKGQNFTAKCFRPTGATKAIEADHNPEVVRKVGRWKSSEVFFQHYVHAKPPKSFSDDLL